MRGGPKSRSLEEVCHGNGALDSEPLFISSYLTFFEI